MLLQGPAKTGHAALGVARSCSNHRWHVFPGLAAGAKQHCCGVEAACARPARVVVANEAAGFWWARLDE